MIPIPAIKALNKIGKDIKNARKRRRITAILISERANISRTTLGKIEKGDPTTSIGNYASVLYVLGMIDRLKDIADSQYDITGQQLEEENLPQRVRLPNKLKKKNHD